MAVSITAGISCVWHTCIGERVPNILELSGANPIRHSIFAYDNDHVLSKWDEAEAWEGIQTALLILDQVCPEVSVWVREKQAKGEIVWKKETDGTYATFNWVDRTLTVNRVLFSENNAYRASVLAHEYRHHQQGLPVMYNSILCYLINGSIRYEIAENDAHLFEYQVYLAIID